MGTSQFYDDLAAYYDLIYVDWEGSMARQGEAIHQMLASYFPLRSERAFSPPPSYANHTRPLSNTGLLPLAKASGHPLSFPVARS